MASITIKAPYTAAWQRAVARADINAKAGRRAERIAEKTYRVASSQRDQNYTSYVRSIVNLDVDCTCPAGLAGIPCWHKAAALGAAIARCKAAEAERATAPQPAADAALIAELEAFIDRDPSDPKYRKQSTEEINRKMDRFARQ